MGTPAPPGIARRCGSCYQNPLVRTKENTIMAQINTVALLKWPWLFFELGGTTSQTAHQDTDRRFWFTSGVVPPRGRPVALACPGLIRNGRVLYATNLGWPADADPKQELGIPTTKIGRLYRSG